MEEEFISPAYFSLQLTGDTFVRHNTSENTTVGLDRHAAPRACMCMRQQVTARRGTHVCACRADGYGWERDAANRGMYTRQNMLLHTRLHGAR